MRINESYLKHSLVGFSPAAKKAIRTSLEKTIKYLESMDELDQKTIIANFSDWVKSSIIIESLSEV